MAQTGPWFDRSRGQQMCCSRTPTVSWNRGPHGRVFQPALKFDELKQEMTIVLVTNLVQQAHRLADTTAFVNAGD